MRTIVLVARKSPEICLRATKNLPVFTRQLCKLCCSLSQNSIYTKAWYSQDIGRSHDRHDRRRPHSHTIEEEVKILAHTHSDIGWGVRLSAENGYLSWMRNTYIMTLAGVAMINSQVAPLAPLTGSGVFLVAGLNMMVGSVSFIYNLRKLRKEKHISSLGVRVFQVLVCLHLLLWCSILLVFLPDLEKVEDSLNEELKDI